MPDKSPAKLRVISLGWGVQSFALAAMSAIGILPKVDFAIHADTTFEQEATYRFAEKYTPWLESLGLPVITVSAATALEKFTAGEQVFMPVYTLNSKDKAGQLIRTCTDRWKIGPINRQINRLLQIKGIKREPGCVEQWIGITTDEASRMKDSPRKYITLRYPFLMDTPMSRGDVVEWLTANGFDIPPKSACVFCPYHSRAFYRTLKTEAPGDFRKAVEFDEFIRDKRPGFQSFVYSKCVPLAQADFRNAEDLGQLNLFENECSGLCGV